MTPPPRTLRTHAPAVFGWVESLRAVFGAEGMHAVIKSPGFYASEQGPYGLVVIGIAPRQADPGKTISAGDMALTLKPKTPTQKEILADAHRTPGYR
jgi:hypothetical protein